MPEKKTLEKAKKDKRQGKSASTQAGEFVRAEMHHIREGEHGAKNAKQAIAIGLSEARRAEVKIPAKGQAAKKLEAASPAKQSSETKRKRSAADRSASARKAARTRANEAQA